MSPVNLFIRCDPALSKVIPDSGWVETVFVHTQEGCDFLRGVGHEVFVYKVFYGFLQGACFGEDLYRLAEMILRFLVHGPPELNPLDALALGSASKKWSRGRGGPHVSGHFNSEGER